MENNLNINIIDKKNRLDKAVAYLRGEQKIKTQKDISEKMEISAETVSRALKGLEKYLTDNFLEKFASEFGFNPEWLKKGNGKMIEATIFEVQEEDQEDEDPEEEEDELQIFLKEERKNYDLTLSDISEKTGIPQKILRDFQWDEGELTDEHREKLHYFIEQVREYFIDNAIGEPKGKPTGYYYPDVNASAGFEVANFNNETTRIPIYLPEFGKDVIFINVYGDSMYPKYKSGDMIGIKLTEFQYVVFGHPYVVVFDNGEVNIKYVCKGSDPQHVNLVSENTQYEPREYPLSIIRSFYAVTGCINRERM